MLLQITCARVADRRLPRCILHENRVYGTCFQVNITFPNAYNPANGILGLKDFRPSSGLSLT